VTVASTLAYYSTELNSAETIYMPPHDWLDVIVSLAVTLQIQNDQSGFETKPNLVGWGCSGGNIEQYTYCNATKDTAILYKVLPPKSKKMFILW